MPEPYPTAPKTFISYSWDDDAHKEWVKQLAIRLRVDGVDVTLDRWHAAPGDQIPAFMERAVRENDFVIAVCTSRFKERSDGRGGGVGYEGDIMTTYAFTGGDRRKFIPVLRRGSWREAAPTWLLGRVRIDLSRDPYSESEYEELLRTLHGAREEAPPIGLPPIFEDKRGSQASPAPPPASRSPRSSLLSSVVKVGSVAALLLVAGFATRNPRPPDTSRFPKPVPVPTRIPKNEPPRNELSDAETHFERRNAEFATSVFPEPVPVPTRIPKNEPPRNELSDAETHFERRNAEFATSVFPEPVPVPTRIPKNEPPRNELSDAETHFERGNAEFHGGQYERAITEYTEAIRLNPNDAAAYNNRGNTHSKLGAYIFAISDYDEAIRLNPEKPDFYSNRGNAYAHLGDHGMANADYAKADSLRSKAMKPQGNNVIIPP